jgi:hypothetical protein
MPRDDTESHGKKVESILSQLGEPSKALHQMQHLFIFTCYSYFLPILATPVLAPTGVFVLEQRKGKIIETIEMNNCRFLPSLCSASIKFRLLY